MDENRTTEQQPTTPEDRALWMAASTLLEVTKAYAETCKTGGDRYDGHISAVRDALEASAKLYTYRAKSATIGE
jgi:hypothetical protein